MMATKSRFGYFTILPSHTAAITDYSQKQGNIVSTQHIKIKTEKLKFLKEEYTQDKSRPKSSAKHFFHK